VINTAPQLSQALDLIRGALSILDQKNPPSSLLWLHAFGAPDLSKMIREVSAASASALRETGDWGSVDAIIHEWHASAMVVLSGVYEDALESPADESPLPDPQSIASEQGLTVSDR